MPTKEKVSYPVAIIGGMEFRMTDDKARVYYGGQWNTVIREEAGAYFMFRDRKRWIEREE
jgi:hypothetical protein